VAIRIQHLGRRDEFRFDTTNRAAAAVQALEIFRFLKVNGWDAALARFKPDAAALIPKLDVTPESRCEQSAGPGVTLDLNIAAGTCPVRPGRPGLLGSRQAPGAG
jgi:hypothetical protein